MHIKFSDASTVIIETEHLGAWRLHVMYQCCFAPHKYRCFLVRGDDASLPRRVPNAHPRQQEPPRPRQFTSPRAHGSVAAVLGCLPRHGFVLGLPQRRDVLVDIVRVLPGHRELGLPTPHTCKE